MLSILAESLLIATRTEPTRRDARHNHIDPRDAAGKRRWFTFAGLRG
jgi:hypothetical protein